MDLLTGFILKFLKVRLSGYKTYIFAGGKALTGVGMIITGLVGLAGGMYPDMGLPVMDDKEAIGVIIAGCYAVIDAFQGMAQRAATEKAAKGVPAKGGDPI